ncbi:MAG: helix-turn-helix domain-containing protein [Candidatus Rokubacteria bacterium]|nr:helix-turn-helix domain-containing protein [Candidatus Rokubacteria bacterium]
MTMTETIDRLLTAEEAARFLGLKVATIRRLTYSRDLPAVRPTGKRAVRYRLRDLEALLRMRTQPMRGPASRGEEAGGR